MQAWIHPGWCWLMAVEGDHVLFGGRTRRRTKPDTVEGNVAEALQQVSESTDGRGRGQQGGHESSFEASVPRLLFHPADRGTRGEAAVLLHFGGAATFS